ncbi:hypothetical protein NQ318_001109 [Aromia moschata]|uniref:Uncharacterized protein n=1 Tax=Aromia moschata TaxID=1265417 RepID=A0AAV8ZH75_9CUCU|nr:hypothetical protein NQ318_001109 [Aromia moschata]
MTGTIFKANQIIFLTLVGSIFAHDFDDLHNLGQRITDRVNRELAPLQNLGARITASVDQDLEPIRNGKLDRDIRMNVNRQLAGLENLGQQIEQNVYQSLEPVRAIEIVVAMKEGRGGTTIVANLPGGKKFIVRDHITFECDGSISNENGECSGTLTPFKINKKEDFCYLKNNYAIVNNQICLGSSSISVFNNHIECISSTGTPVLLISLSEYENMCQGLSQTVEYKYIANVNDPLHVEIPNKNKYVKCMNNQPNVCIFTESLSLPKTSNVYMSNLIYTSTSG